MSDLNSFKNRVVGSDIFFGKQSFLKESVTPLKEFTAKNSWHSQ